MIRYEDEEWKKETNNDSQNHLSDLLKRIEERKREREEAAKEAAEKSKVVAAPEQKNDVSDGVPKKKGKKKKGKKRKLDLPLEDVTADVQNEATEENNPKTDIDTNETSLENFTILGSKRRLKTQAAKRVLPSWLTHPEIVHSNLSSGPSLDEIKTELDSNLAEKLKADGFNKLFPVQARVLSWLLKCDRDYKLGRWVRDTCVSMPTGSGEFLILVFIL